MTLIHLDLEHALKMAACLRWACFVDNRVLPASFRIVQSRCNTSTTSDSSGSAGQEYLTTAPDAIPESPVRKTFEELNLPLKKERGPLTVLQSLASTVRDDGFGLPHMFINDQALAPAGINSKMRLLLAKVSGRTAARNILKKHPECFNLGLSKPDIAAYRARKHKLKFETGVEALEERIKHRLVVEAVKCYEELQVEGVEVSDEVKTDLLELCCVYNNEDPTFVDPEMLLIEKTQISLMSVKKQKPESFSLNNWRRDGAAMRIFNSFEEKTPRVYTSVIRGMCKHGDCDSAFDLLVKGVNNKIQFERVVFHDVLQCIALNFKVNRSGQTLKDHDLSTVGVSILAMMQHQNVQVNSRSFELAIAITTNAKTSFRLFNEALTCGLEPTPPMWKSMLRFIYYKISSDDRDMLPIRMILDQFKENKLRVQIPEDNELFIEMVTHAMIDHDIAMEIHQVYSSGPCLMFPDFHMEETYYLRLFRAAILTEDLDIIMDAVNTYLPYRAYLNSQMAESILLLMLHQRKYEYLKEFWADICEFQRFDKDILDMVLELMQFPEVKEEDYDLFSGYVTNLLDFKLHMRIKGKPTMLTAKHLGAMIGIHIRANNMDKAWKVLEILEENAELLPSVPSPKVVEQLFETSFSSQNIKRSRSCVNVMVAFKMKNAAKFKERLDSAIKESM